jgi:hypothetical protein
MIIFDKDDDKKIGGGGTSNIDALHSFSQGMLEAIKENSASKFSENLQNFIEVAFYKLELGEDELEGDSDEA